MKLAHSLSLALAIAAVAPAWAAEDDQHKGHHPAGTAPAPSSSSTSAKPSRDMARMDNQMKTMREMHDKMTAAKTPEERNALMAEHMKAMQGGMTMMDGMSAGGAGGMQGDMAGRHPMMENAWK